ncbi:hypothetical protein P170DRAFT_431276 [Aspergillus steynii IBT 23096]|uniref:Uncharacterized protein n=1 Tax=Aspergillus steynii IBT 23096 TaxID=1392250 RepID=A0A2I2FRU2_9EURO|nr:uncharacterized protein P170DRAFT_431276 [Aspergillus steynii IBT 23096]PLB43326.1 hypothetical protein P170DRAFT_431276 [Aspergillus steynii IBT 23096]
MTSNSTTREGWSTRRPSRCYGSETGHSTWGSNWSCCPPNTTERVDDDNNTRCYLDDPGDKLSSDFPNQCANSSLVLWSDSGNYFCCEETLVGFMNKDEYKGCGAEGEVREAVGDGTVVKIVDQHGKPTATETSTSTSISTSTSMSSASTSPLPSTSSSSVSSTNKGAIAGGVVGGVGGALLIMGIIWFFLRRRRLTRAGFSTSAGVGQFPRGQSNQMVELDGGLGQKELPDSSRPSEVIKAVVYAFRVELVEGMDIENKSSKLNDKD